MKNSISFDIQIYVPSFPAGEQMVHIQDIKNLSPLQQQEIIHHYKKGLLAQAKIVCGNMMCVFASEYLDDILRWCLDCPRGGFGSSKLHHSIHEVIFFSTYNPENPKIPNFDRDWLMIYLADNQNKTAYAENEKYGCYMRPISSYTADGILEEQKVVIVPTKEFYKIAYEKVLEVKNAFKEIGIEDEMAYFNQALPLAEAYLLHHNINIKPVYWTKNY